MVNDKTRFTAFDSEWLLRSTEQALALIAIVFLLQCDSVQLQKESLVVLGNSDQKTRLVSKHQLELSGYQFWLRRHSVIKFDEAQSSQSRDVNRILLQWKKSNAMQDVGEEWHVSSQLFLKENGDELSRSKSFCAAVAALHLFECSHLKETFHPGRFAFCSCDVLDAVSRLSSSRPLPDCLAQQSTVSNVTKNIHTQACFSGWWLSAKGPVWMNESVGWLLELPHLSSWFTNSFMNWQSRHTSVLLGVHFDMSEVHLLEKVQLSSKPETALQVIVPSSSSMKQLHTGVQDGERISSSQHWFMQGDQVQNEKRSCEIGKSVNHADHLKWHVQGTGLHRQLFVSVNYDAIVDAEQCTPVLVLHLSTGVYVDTDELQNLALHSKMKVHSFDSIDVEQPAVESTQHVVMVTSTNHSSVKWMHLSIPVHLRYQMPNFDRSHGCTFFQAPQLLLECTDNDGSLASSGQPCLLNSSIACQRRPVNSLRDETLLSLCLPVGKSQLESFVLWTTISVTSVACVYLIHILGTIVVTKEHVE